MSLTLLAAALASQPPTLGPVTARFMYEGCARLTGRLPPSSPGTDSASASEALAAAVCAASIAAAQAAQAANDAMADTDSGRTPSFCPPESVLTAEDPTLPIARAYLAWFEQHPDAQNEADGSATLPRALEETWPCPH